MNDILTDETSQKTGYIVLVVQVSEGFCLTLHWTTKFYRLVQSESISFPDCKSNTLPNCEIWDLTELKAFADDNINVAQKVKLALGMVENIVRKGENAGYQHFLLFPQCFKKTAFSASL